jgi:ketosteroid isomerase-like protein
MENTDVIKNFYTAFQNKDWNGMQACYHQDVSFNDPVFRNLKGNEAKAMWHMLLAASTDLEIIFSDVQASGKTGSCKWEAFYSFSKTGRKVHNKISATFEFENNLIISHHDTFDLWAWSRMALGLSGVLLGWSPFMKQKIGKMAKQNLANFISKNSSYQQ